MNMSNYYPNISYLQEKSAYELEVGDKIVRSNDGQIFRIDKITDFCGVRGLPNLYLSGPTGPIEHDTRFDSEDEKYMCYKN